MAIGGRLTVFAVGIVAGAGALALLGWAAPQTPSDAAIVDAIVTTTEAVPGAEDTVVTFETIVPVKIDGIDPAVGRVLDARGFAERIDRTALEKELDPSIVRVLIDRDAVIAVAREGGP